MTKFLGNVLVTLVSFFLTLCLVEFGFRTFAPQIIDCKVNYEWRLDDPVLPYVPKPNYHGKMEVKDQFSADLTTNAQGFRATKDIPVARTPGARRLLFLGDSFVFGWGVNDNEVFTSVVEKELSGTLDAKPVEVMNAAVYGFDIVQYFEMFNRVIKYAPDVLFLGFTLENDFNITPLQTDTVTKSIRIEVENDFKYKFRNFINRLHLVTLIRDRLYIHFPWIRNFMLSLGVNHKRDIFLKDYPAPLRESMQKTGEILKQMKSVCDQRKIRFVVLLIPLREQVYCRNEINRFPGFDIEKPNKTLKAILDRNKIESIDFLPLLLAKSKQSPKRLYFDTDPHWTKYGHEVAAQQIVEFLRGSGREKQLP